MTIAYTYGIVDFLHFGHMRVMRNARNASDKLIFGLIEDPAILQFHGNTISTYQERYSVLSGVSYIDEIRAQKSFDPLKNLKQIHSEYPDEKIILYVGTDRSFLPVEKYMESIGGEIRITDYYEKLSPPNILAALQKKVDRKEKMYSNLVSTKANTLIALKERLTKAKIEDIVVVTVDEFRADEDAVYRNVADYFKGDTIVVRSSSSAEDCYESSNAGHFDSVLNVASDSKEEVTRAIVQVICSYNTEAESSDEQVLIQRQTKKVVCSGVIFTRDVRSNRPYYLINYDDSGSTDSVTSGMAGKSVWILRKTAKQNAPKKWAKLLEAVLELESILKKMVLDIEFALTEDGQVVIFQVRPLAANYKYNVKQNDEAFYANIEEAKAEYGKYLNYATDKLMMLSDMAFWNPSEIIGVNPLYLDYSLYREIITRRAWIDGLLPLGYTDVPNELMYRVGNKPYISVDYSFQALTPAAIAEDVKKKLWASYTKKLLNYPHLHDKIEFEIVHSAFDYATEKRLQALKEEGFTDSEIKEIRDELFALTDDAISRYPEILADDKADLEHLEQIRLQLQTRLETEAMAPLMLLNIITTLLMAIDQYGTPQFSRQARCAFISRQICKTMVDEGRIDGETMDAFMSTIHSVSSDFERDFYRYSHGQMSKADFDAHYGHLRANTYDIRTPRYADIAFQIAETEGHKSAARVGENSDAKSLVAEALKALHLSAPVEQQVAFIKQSIEQREYFKFIFTRSLSMAIELIRTLGQNLGIAVDDLSYLTVPELRAAKCYEKEDEVRDFFITIIARRKELFEKKSMLMLPEMITEASDLEMIEQRQSKPNFITVSKVQADVVVLKDSVNTEIAGRIVALEKADPGYDWIFAKGIAGLVTKYGGPASHMAIRCAEFGLPSAIGCGEQTFNYVCASERIEIDCNNKKINRRY